MMKILQSGKAAFYPTKGLQTTVRVNGSKHEVLNVTLSDGRPVDPEETYIGLTIDFLLRGGDDFGKVIP